MWSRWSTQWVEKSNGKGKFPLFSACAVESQSREIFNFRVHRNLCNLCVVRPPRQFQQQRVNITSDGSQLFGDCGRSWQQHFYFDVAIKIIIKSLFWAVARESESERHWLKVLFFMWFLLLTLRSTPVLCLNPNRSIKSSVMSDEKQNAIKRTFYWDFFLLKCLTGHTSLQRTHSLLINI